MGKPNWVDFGNLAEHRQGYDTSQNRSVPTSAIKRGGLGLAQKEEEQNRKG